MGLANCPECGKLFVENSSGLCPACYELEEYEELKIVGFLRERGKASIEEIREATGVKEKTILRMMKRGRFKGTFDITHPCESCGEQISEGRLCPQCSKNFTDQLKSSQERPQEEKTARNRVYSQTYFKK